PIGAIPELSSRPDTTRFVEVPITVIVPPRMVPKDTGIRYHDGGRPRFSAQSATWGATIATIGVLFRIADAAEVGMRRRASPERTEPPFPSDPWMSGWSAPDFSTPRATMKSAATVIGAALEKPESACSVVVTPRMRRRTSAPRTAMAGGTVSRTRRTTVTTTTIRVIQADRVIRESAAMLLGMGAGWGSLPRRGRDSRGVRCRCGAG